MAFDNLTATPSHRKQLEDWVHKIHSAATLGLLVLPSSVVVGGGGWCDDEDGRFQFYGRGRNADVVQVRLSLRG